MRQGFFVPAFSKNNKVFQFLHQGIEGIQGQKHTRLIAMVVNDILYMQFA